MAQGQGLHDHVADRRSVGGGHHQGAPQGVGDEMVQQRIGRSAEQVEPRDLAPGKLLDLLQGLAILQGEALQHAANDRTGLARHRLVGFPAEGLDLQRHVARLEEARIGWVDQRFKRGRGARQVREQTVIDLAVLFLPEAAALFQNPEADRLLGEPNRPAVADLVGEVQCAAGVGDDRLGEFGAHHRPGAQLQVSPAFSRTDGQSDQRRGRFVRTGGDDLRVFQSGALGNFRTQRSQFRARRNEGRKQLAAADRRALSSRFDQVLGDRVVKLRGAGLRHFEARDPGQQIIEGIGNRQQVLGPAEAPRALGP